MSDTDSNQPKGTSKLNSLMNDLTFSNDAIDKISNAFSVSDETQYDFIDQDAVKRTWYQMASHDVAVTYIGGIFFTLPSQSPPRLCLGGLYGMYEGFKIKNSPYFKIRLNNMLNKVTLRGPALGNALGVVTMMYCTNVMIYEKACDQFGIRKNDLLGPGLSAFCTGLLYKCTTGGKSAVLAGLIGIGVVGSLKMVQYIQKKMHVSGRWRSILIL